MKTGEIIKEIKKIEKEKDLERIIKACEKRIEKLVQKNKNLSLEEKIINLLGRVDYVEKFLNSTGLSEETQDWLSFKVCKDRYRTYEYAEIIDWDLRNALESGEITEEKYNEILNEFLLEAQRGCKGFIFDW